MRRVGLLLFPLLRVGALGIALAASLACADNAGGDPAVAAAGGPDGIGERPVLADGVRFVVGNDLWQPGTRFTNGADWLALSCIGSACSLEPARLRVKAESWQGHYDDQATAGQKLNFSKAKPGAGKVIAWFHPDARHAWLKPGPVTTYASSAGRVKRPTSDGTLEVAIEIPGGKQATLVPLLDREASVFRLQLRDPGRRQMLGELGRCSGAVAADYFLWAGDLDGDGGPDYLVSFVDDEGQVILYLASAADQGAQTIAGVAGAYDAPPYGGECDGDGWLSR